MSRPRWHDALIVVAIVAVTGYGVWALWWGDVGRQSTDDATSGSASPRAPMLSSGPQA